MGEWDDWNASVVADFRATDGRPGGDTAGFPILLLHHTGRRSGTVRVNPLVYRREGEAYAVFASKGGSDDDPDWYRNLVTHPEATVEVGADTVPVTARTLDRGERDPIWARHKAEFPNFADYENSTSRTIPVVLLEPRS